MEMSELVDSAAGVFTASYDPEGKLTSEVYPNGMCANQTYDSVGEATHIEYVKTTNCGEAKPTVWFSETRTPSVRGEPMSRTSTLSSETYVYDTLGRLTETQETPAGQYCKTRVYGYDEESNRTSLTTREPNSKDECATEGGTIQEHTYDEANRLIDSGIEYDPLANVTKLPAADAEGHELKSTFYVDNAVATQEQNGVRDEYMLDPAGRVRETLTGAKKVLSHYDASGEAVAWTCEVSSSTNECESGSFTRNILGIDGTLSAVQTGGASVLLQLHDLEGDVVATAADNTTETKLRSTYNSTEFGVPNGGKAPPPFAWLGAGGLESALPTGVITFGATSYVPQLGMPLQTEEVAPPGLPGGSGGQAATFVASPWNLQGAERVGSEAPGLEAAREREASALAALTASIDPAGLMTGGEALELAKELKKSAENLSYYLNEGEVCEADVFAPSCELELSSGEEQDKSLATGLAEKCAFQVRNVGYFHGHLFTKTCLVAFNYSLYADNYVVKPGWTISLCFSFRVGTHSITYETSSWWCESDGKWHSMGNRGFWHDYE
jgi:hypothetical protein